MNFRGYAELAVNFPDEQVEKDGQIIDLGGRTAAESISEILRGLGYDASPPEYAGDHGWDLNVYVDRKRIWLEIQPGPEKQEHILQIEAMAGFFRRLFGIDLTYYAEFLTKLNEGLRHDRRFASVRWYAVKNHHNPTGQPADEPLKVMDWRG
jgi:hypothetical protein